MIDRSRPSISVLMSAKDSEETIGTAIESILIQTFDDIELLIVDDGSNDETYNRIKKYAKEDSRIKLYKNDKNLGLTKSLNKLISLSEAEFLARQDTDDYSSPDRLEIQINKIIDDKFDAVTSRAKVINTEKVIPRVSNYFPNKLVMKYKNPFVHGTLLIKRGVINSVGGYDEKFKYSQDYKLYKDLLKNNYRIGFIHNLLYFLNTEDNISQNFKKEQNYYFNCAKNNIDPES